MNPSELLARALLLKATEGGKHFELRRLLWELGEGSEWAGLPVVANMVEGSLTRAIDTRKRYRSTVEAIRDRTARILKTLEQGGTICGLGELQNAGDEIRLAGELSQAMEGLVATLRAVEQIAPEVTAALTQFAEVQA